MCKNCFLSSIILGHENCAPSKSRCFQSMERCLCLFRVELVEKFVEFRVRLFAYFSSYTYRTSSVGLTFRMCCLCYELIPLPFS